MGGYQFTRDEINEVSCNIATKKAKADLKRAVEPLVKHDIDLVICEYFRNINEMEWAIKIAVDTGKPVAASMCIGPTGDENEVPVGECAVRMAKAGVKII